MMVPDKANNNFCPIELKKTGYSLSLHLLLFFRARLGIKRQSTVIENPFNTKTSLRDAPSKKR